MAFFRKINNYFNFFYPWIISGLNFIITLAAAYIGINVHGLERRHPRWIYQIDLIYYHLVEILLICALLNFIIGLIYLLNKKTLKQLESELNKEKIKTISIAESIDDLFNGYLLGISRKLKFSLHSERITLYLYDDRNKQFSPFARYSASPEYDKIRRTVYPENQGCLSKAWHNGWWFDNNYGESLKEFIERNKTEYNIPAKISKNIKMQSKLYSAKRIHVNNKAIAVIVFESTDKDKYEENELKLLLDDQEEIIANFINNFKNYIPELKNAALRRL